MIQINPAMAEICGIHAGDGYLRNDGKRKELDISGNPDEKEYYDEHVTLLFKEAFNFRILPRVFSSRGTYGFVVRNEEIIKLVHSFGFPYGKKSLGVKVPLEILNSKDEKIICSFLRGLFDTDGHLSFRRNYGKKYISFKTKYPVYPTIALTTVSYSLSRDVMFLLKQLGFSFNQYTYVPKKNNEAVSYKIIINGREGLAKWMGLVGIKNPSKFSRYLVWSKFGFCPTNISFNQRKGILKGEIDPYTIGL